MSIEVINNESVFSEALDHLSKLQDTSRSENNRFNFNKSLQGNTLASLLQSGAWPAADLQATNNSC